MKKGYMKKSYMKKSYMKKRYMRKGQVIISGGEKTKKEKVFRV
jgi:hypothetical protein